MLGLRILGDGSEAAVLAGSEQARSSDVLMLGLPLNLCLEAGAEGEAGVAAAALFHGLSPALPV